MTTKNITVDGVCVEAAKLPRELRPLLEYAAEWCFLDDRTAHDDLETMGEAAIRKFVSACKVRLGALEDFCLAETSEATDEAVLMRALYQNFLVARSYLWMLENKRRHKSASVPAFHHD
jgi:hypothetical protein